MTDIVCYSFGQRQIYMIGGENGVELSSVYSPDYLNYEKDDFEWDSYEIGDNGLIDIQQQGPKDQNFASTCKIRAYYHNIPFYGALVTAMYDFTGFLVGDDTLLTCAHGLWLDATSGILDDGVRNMFFPGRVEIYGAIGLGDQWGKNYKYYAKATEAYLKSDYLTNRSFGRDWAVLRLDTPIGKDLGYRILTPYSDSNPSFKMVGYPTYNQSHEHVSLTNPIRNLMNGTVNYSSRTSDGMSGSPIYNSYPHNSEYTILTHPFNELRKAYAIHLGYDPSSGNGIGIWIGQDIRELTEELNKKYRPNTITVDFTNDCINSADGRQSIRFSEDYSAQVVTTNAELIDGGTVLLSGDSRLLIEFDFPVSGVSFSFQTSTQLSASRFFVCSNDFYGNTEVTMIGNNHSGVTCGLKTYSIEFTTLKRNLSFVFTNPPSLQEAVEWVKIQDISIAVSWNTIPTSINALSFDPHEMDLFENRSLNPDENCVTYAIGRHMDYRRLCETVHDYQNHSLHSGIVPGYISNTYIPRQKPFKQRLNSLKADFEQLGIGFHETKKYEPCGVGWYKIAIMIDLGGYYHFLRENNDGLWSHYFKDYGIFREDSLGNPITDPEDAVLVSLYNETNTNENPWGNSVPVGTEGFDTLKLYGYFAVKRMDE